MFSLLRLNGPRKDERLQLEGQVIRLGRARSNEVGFDRERERVVGNYHAEIRIEDGSYVLFDLQSTHGTYVNDQRVTRWRLQEGDIIGLSQQVGGPLLRFSRRIDESLPVTWARGEEPPPVMATGYNAAPGQLPHLDESFEQTSFAPTAVRSPQNGWQPERTAVSRGAPPGRPAASALPGQPAGGPPVDHPTESLRPPPPPGTPRAGVTPAGSYGHPGAAPAGHPVGAGQGGYPAGLEVTGRLGEGGAPPGTPVGGTRGGYARGVEPDISSTWHRGASPEPLQGGRQAWKGGDLSPPGGVVDPYAVSGTFPGPQAHGAPDGTGSTWPLPANPGYGAPVSPGGAQGDMGQEADLYPVRPGALLEPLELPPAQAARPGAGTRLRGWFQKLRAGSSSGTEPAMGPDGGVGWSQGSSGVAPAPEEERYYPKPFVLEEAIKEKPRPEWIWLHRHRWPLRLIVVLMVLGWIYGDHFFRWISGKPVDPVPVLESRSMKEPLIEPPGIKNPELVRMVQALQSRIRSLPPPLSNDGDVVLHALRPVLRRAGENSNFIPADFVTRISEEIEVLRKQPDYEFIYTRCLKYQPQVAGLLADAHLPEIFSYVPWLESGFVPTFSDVRVGRAGLWGMSADVARRHGLQVEKKRDERLKWELETRAAASYLIELVGEVRGQSFLLGASAYRKGPLGARGLLAQRSVWKVEEITLWSFYRQSYLPGDMLGYLVRLLAVATLNETPERFGLPPREALGYDRKAPPQP